MKIEIAVEKGSCFVRFDKPTNNFPFEFTFMDRLSKNIIEVYLDLDSMKEFYKSMKERIDLEKLIN